MKINILIAFLLLVFGSLEARHIIGGEITYECLGTVGGGVRYKFTMLIYRDCACTNCAPFDEVAAIGIYQCGVNQECGNLNTMDIFSRERVEVEDIQNVNPPDFPCLEIPPNICVQKGRYEFEKTLPLSDESYHIIYQRCCRNVTINNIFDPEAAGASYSVVITP
ncbi:MAG: hypothetical protein AAF849_11605, partial [Bacteroidota bacterium]